MFGIQQDLDDAIKGMDSVKKMLRASEKRCTEAEEALAVSRQKRQQNFEEMNQM